MKARIGVDVGAEGAYAVFLDGNLMGYGKMPKIEEELSMSLLIDQIWSYIPAEKHSLITSWHACMEDLHSVYESSASSNFTFGVNNGLVMGMLQVVNLPYTKIQAKRWQKEMWEGIRPVEKISKGKFNKDGSQKYKIDTKATSKIAAARLFPDEKFLPSPRCRVPDDGLVDATLIGLYCVRHF